MTVFEQLDIRPVVNCCGVYTDLGGTVLSADIWNALSELNGAFVGMPQLLDASGSMIAGLIGAEAARVTPGASAAITLAVAATMTGENDSFWTRLPDTDGMRNEVLLPASHLKDYKYSVCVRLSGARLVAAGPDDAFDLPELLEAITDRTACIFIPAHLLDGFRGIAQLARAAKAAKVYGLPVVVDAAYMVYPTRFLRLYFEAGADLVCFSAKYFGGPSSGGFVAGRADLIRAVRGLDFTCFESGPHQCFGRAFKMSRYDVAATALALRAWMRMDHGERIARYAERVSSIASSLPELPDIEYRKSFFSMSEELVEGEPNCLVIRFPRPQAALEVKKRLESEDPIIATVHLRDLLVIAVDCLLDGQEKLVSQRLRAALIDCTAQW